jgi:hypothetical protein
MDRHLLVRLDRVAGKLDTIAGLPEQPGIFGAGTHRFLVGPPVSERVVADSSWPARTASSRRAGAQPPGS